MTLIIDVGMIPDCGDPVAVESAAGTLQGQAGTISARGSLIHTTWQRVAGSYEAPEGAKLRAATRPVQSRAEHVAQNISGVAGALSNFARDLTPIKQELDSLKQQAQAFNAWAWAHPDWEKHPEQNRDVNDLPIPNGYLREGINEPDAWYDKIIHEIAGTVAKLQQARQQCAWWINRYVDQDMLPARRAPTRDEAHEHRELYDSFWNHGLVDPSGMDFPWGSAFKVSTANPHPNFVQRFAVRFTGDWESMNQFTQAAFGYHKDGWDALPGGHFTAQTFTSTWKGIRDLVIATSGAGSLVSGGAFVAGKVAGDKGLAAWGARNSKRNAGIVRDLGKSLVGWDGWKQGPAEGLADVSFNVATAVVPGPAKIGGAMLAVKGASLVEHAGAGMAAKFLGVSMQVPKFVSDGGLVATHYLPVGEFINKRFGALGSYDVIPREAGSSHPFLVDNLEHSLARTRLITPDTSFETRLAVMRAVLGDVQSNQQSHDFALAHRTFSAAAHRSVVDAWHHLPEPLRDKIVEEVTLQGGPADMTKDLPSDYWATDDQQSDPAFAAALAELRAHPDVLLRYLLMND